jgi:hypothetical protein
LTISESAFLPSLSKSDLDPKSLDQLVGGLQARAPLAGHESAQRGLIDSSLDRDCKAVGPLARNERGA